MKKMNDQERLREIADRLMNADFGSGFVPSVVVDCYKIAYAGLKDKRGFIDLSKDVT